MKVLKTLGLGGVLGLALGAKEGPSCHRVCKNGTTTSRHRDCLSQCHEKMENMLQDNWITGLLGADATDLATQLVEEGVKELLEGGDPVQVAEHLILSLLNSADRAAVTTALMGIMGGADPIFIVKTLIPVIAAHVPAVQKWMPMVYSLESFAEGTTACQSDILAMGKDKADQAALASANLVDAVAMLYGISQKAKDLELDSDETAGLVELMLTASNYGNPDLCQDLEGMHHCELSAKALPQPFSPMYGLCMPMSCSLDHVLEVGETVTHQDLRGVLSVQCGQPEYTYGSAQKGAVFLLMLPVLAVLIGTCLEYSRDWSLPGRGAAGYLKEPLTEAEGDAAKAERREGMEEGEAEMVTSGRHKKNILERYFLCFGLRENWSDLWSLEQKGGGEYKILDGIRVLSMLWVIFGHTAILRLTEEPGVANVLDVSGPDRASWQTKLLHQPALSSFTSVDCFFVLGGMLLALLGLPKLRRRGAWRAVPFMYLLRWLRLTPPVLFMVVFQTYIFPLLGDGVFWNFDYQVESCRQYWWTNLLYVQNLVPFDNPANSCLGEAWYLGADMQLFMISVWLLLLYTRRSTLTVCLMVVACLASCFYQFGFALHWHLHHTFVDTTLDKARTGHSWGADLYFHTWYRFTPYFVGLLAGIFYLEVFRGNIPTPKLKRVMTFVSCLTIGYHFVWPWFAYQNTPSPVADWQHAVYIGFGKAAWSIGLSTVCLQGFTNSAGLVGWLLGWRAWIPLAKLSFGAFLTHGVFLNWLYYTRRTPLPFTDINNSIAWGGFSVLGYTAAIPLYLAVEHPAKRLVDEFLMPAKAKKVSQAGSEKKAAAGGTRTDAVTAKSLT
ncbi:unnamed protein product [Chrysoparadoxa australica]